MTSTIWRLSAIVAGVNAILAAVFMDWHSCCGWTVAMTGYFVLTVNTHEYSNYPERMPRL